MPWSRTSQRVLFVLAAGLLALAVAGGVTTSRPIAAVVPDDAALDLRLDLNSATPVDLETLPGVGASLAARIDTYRRANGPFHAVEELRKVPGFSEKLVATLRPLVTVR